MLPRLCFPEGLVSVRVISGTPDTLEVKAMVPLAKAARGRPEGARVTVRLSTTSAYSSLEVCRTPDLLHGRAGVFSAARGVGAEFAGLLGLVSHECPSHVFL